MEHVVGRDLLQLEGELRPGEVLIWPPQHRRALASLTKIRICTLSGWALDPDTTAPIAPWSRPTSSTWLGGWVQTYLVQFQSANYTPGSWGTLVYYNQSLAGMMSRMFLCDWAWTDGAMQVINLTPAFPPMGPRCR